MNHDTARTAIRTRRMIFRPTPHGEPDHGVNVLPVGTHLGEFEIRGLIGEGGFGIVYLAYDHSLERQVALKEYMPSGLATRTTRMAVNVRSQQKLPTFTAGLKSFINEARMLARFDSPALVKVHSFWEGNGTAYMVMPYYEGSTLKQALYERKIKPTESWIRMLLADLFDAIEILHQSNCLHRDIAPDNILLLKDGRPLLLDFGAARRVIGDLTQCFTAILKPGFAPIEQYADIAGLRQGAWTDIYALAAVVYYLITGQIPPAAVARMVHDDLVPAREAGKGRYSAKFLACIDKGLAVKPEQRFQSIEEMRRALDIRPAEPRTVPGENTEWPATAVRTAAAAPENAGTYGTSAAGAQARRDTRERSGDDATVFIGAPDSRIEPTISPPAVPMPAASAANTAYAAHDMRGAHAGPAPLTQMADGAGKVPPRRAAQKTASPAAPSRQGLLMLVLLFTFGIGTGIYLGANRSWDGLSARSILPQDPAPAALPPLPDTPLPDMAAAPPASLPSPEGTPSAAASPSSASAGSSEAGTAAGAGSVESPPSSAIAPPPEPPQPTTATAPSEAPPAAENKVSEIAQWKAAIRSNKADDYAAYLRAFPQGRYTAIATRRLERLQAAAAPVTETRSAATTRPSAPAQAQAPAIPRKPDEAGWHKASTINSRAAYQEYLKKFPRGGYAAIARDRIASLDKPAEAQAPAAVALAPATPASAATSPSSSAPTSVTSTTQAPAPAATAASATTAAGTSAPSQATAARSGPDAKAPDTAALPPVAALPPAETVRQATAEQKEADAGKGQKTLKFDDQTMTGNFSVDRKSGLVSGQVKIVWSNGNQYEGNLVQGSKEGKGKFIWNTGQRYSGDWANDAPNGKGSFIFTDGSRYEGLVKDGMPHGHGTSRFRNGNTYTGEWVRGKSHGRGRYTWTDGSYWEGEFRDDRKTENGKLHRPGEEQENSTGAAPAEAGMQRAAATPSLEQSRQ